MNVYNDLSLNISCSHREPDKASKKLPPRMPDGSRIDANRNLTKKIIKTHLPATSSGTVFIPKHKLPVLDEFGLSAPCDESTIEKYNRRDKDADGPSKSRRSDANHRFNQKESLKNEDKKDFKKNPSSTNASEAVKTKNQKRRARRVKEDEPKIIPKEVQLVAGGLPPSFPKHRIKKFTEEYHIKKRKLLEENDNQEEDEAEVKKRRRSFVPGLNPRKREKAAHLFTDLKLQDLEDLHPYLVSNLEQNLTIKNLTKIQSLVMPELLKTRWNSEAKEFVINSGIGSGKILSYVVPIVNNLALMEPRIDRTAGIYALVLLPTRELAAQVYDTFVKLCKSFLWVVPGLLTGGERKKSEKARLRKGLNILITTPGRLIDHMEHSRSMEFSKMKYCVLGDAHKLLDPERVEVAKRIAIVLRKRLPKDCIRCIVTSTLTKKLEKLIEIVVSKPKIIDAFKTFE